MTVLKWLAALALLGYFGGLALLYFAQRSILFPIPETRRTSPNAAGFPQAEEHLLQTTDGEKLVAWHVPPRAGKPVVVFFHGNGDILAWRAPWFATLTADGTGLVAISFRGYAGSSGSPSEAGLLNDAEAAYAFAEETYPQLMRQDLNRVPLLLPLMIMMYIPGVPALGERAYRWVTEHRSHLPVAGRYRVRTP